MKHTIPRIYAILLFAFPIVCNYDVFLITPSLLYCVVGFLLAFVFLEKGNRLILDLRVIPYLIYILLSAMSAIISSEENSLYTLFMKLTLYTLTVIVFYVCYWQIMDLEFAIRFYKAITLIVTLIIIIQYMLAILDKGICLVLPGIPVTGVDGLMTDQIRDNQILTNRYSSFFFEPAHQAQYVLPCLALTMFEETTKKRESLAFAAVVTIGLFCTTSMIGILGAAILWSYYIFVALKSKKIDQWAPLLLLVPLLVAGVLYFASRDDLMTLLQERIGSLNLFSRNRTEGFRRMKYGWFCYAELNGFQKLFGVGYQNIGYYLSKSGIGFRLLGTNDVNFLSYTNGITKMLIGIGIVGTIMNLRLFLFDALRSKDICSYGLLLVWGIIMFTSNAFDDLGIINIMVLIMCKVYGEKKVRLKQVGILN